MSPGGVQRRNAYGRLRLPAPWPAGRFLRFVTGGALDDAGVVHSVQEITGHHPRNFEQWAHDHAHAFTDRV